MHDPLPTGEVSEAFRVFTQAIVAGVVRELAPLLEKPATQRQPAASSDQPHCQRLTDAQAAKWLGVSRRTMFELRKRGLRHYVIANQFRYAPADLAAWNEKHAAAPSDANLESVNEKPHPSARNGGRFVPVRNADG